MRYWPSYILLLFTFSQLSAQNDLVQWSLGQLRHIQERETWVDSVYNELSTDQQIAQFFMVAAYSNKDATHEQLIEDLVTQHHIGGIIMMQGGPQHQVEMLNRYQSKSKIPLLISTDAEWGLQMRLKDSTMAFPYQLTLGAIKDDALITTMGAEIARQLKRTGVQVSFSPVVDVNNNPNNPVINFRSFGEDKMNVALKGLAYMEGLQKNGVMACAKHFPGHGDTDSDSHLTLPVIKHDIERLKDLELYPFRILINNGVQSVMAAHLFIPALDSTKNQATSLSRKVVTDMLKKDYKFKGLVFSDALNMKGVSQYYPAGEVAVNAFIAGNDILLFAEDVPKGIELMKKALADGRIDKVEFSQRLKKLLAAKFDLGLDHFDSLSIDNIYQDLHTPEAWLLNNELYAAAMTIAANKDNMLPVVELDKSFASVAIGDGKQTLFQSSIDKYAAIDNYSISKNSDAAAFNKLVDELSSYHTVFISLHDMSQYSSKKYGITPQTVEFINKLTTKTRVVLTVFGNPYSLKYFDNVDWVLEAYQENEHTQELAAEVLFGARGASGSLPVTASDKYTFGVGMETESLGRLRYSIPEAVGIDQVYFEKIDSIANAAIADKATPGCQILVAKNGHVIYQKSFGYHTYDSITPVTNTDLYDLASITKVAATTISLMKLYDERKIQINRKLSSYLPMLDTTEMKNVVIRDVLAHKAGLKSWIPFYMSTVPDSVYKVCYRTDGDSVYCLPVSPDMFMHKDYRDTIYSTIFNTPINPKPHYVYSDLGFMMFKEAIEEVTEEPFDEFTYKNFYHPLGMSHMVYNPLKRFPLKEIVPTEDDKVFRKTLVHGYVHDPAAAMLGGVAGHAGLFADANDLAILMQMLLNKGRYAGKEYIEDRTVQMFTKKNDDESRRGLGFDKPETDISVPGPTAIVASPRSFGHSGFTGTCVWVDPDQELIFVFLSNRVNPSADNRKLISNNIRTEIHQAIYDAILKSEQQPTKSAEQNLR